MNIRLVVESGAQRRHAFRMRLPETVIGRKTGCGIRIPSAEVSRQHCRLRFEDGLVVVEDLESANGTLLNKEPIQGRQVARPGDRLQVGPITFVVEYELAQEVLDRLARQEAGELDEFQLVDEPAAQTDEGAVPLPMSEAGPELVLPDLDEELPVAEPEPEEEVEELPLLLDSTEPL